MNPASDPAAALADALGYVLGKAAHADAIVRHDPATPSDVDAFAAIAAAGGCTADRYPALHQRLRSGGRAAAFAGGRVLSDNTGAFVDNQKVDYLSTTTRGLASAHATLTRTKAVSQVFLALSAVNVTGGQTRVLASQTLTAYNTQTVEIGTNDATAQPLPTTGSNFGVISWSVQYADGTTDTSHASTQWAYQTASDPVVTAPVQRSDRHTGDMNDIVIGLARGYSTPANNTDIDYWFWQGQVTNTTLLTPLQGSMKFLYPIAPLNATNPVLEFYLARSEGGMADLKANNTQPYMSGFSIDPADPTKINFSLMPTATAAGNAINFGLSPWVADTRTFFTARVTVTFQDPQFGIGWSSILSSTTPNNDPTDGVTFIKPIVYVWHCLAAGTMVTLADGTAKAVENCDSGDVVRSGSTTRKVLATLAQPHWGTVLTVALSNGATITCSGTHPFLTPAGAVQASALAVGNTVSVAGGTSTVRGIQSSQQSGQPLYNLWLDPAAAGQTVFLANGIVVGDYQMQVALVTGLQNNPNHVRAMLPQYLHADYASHLEDRAAPAA